MLDDDLVLLLNDWSEPLDFRLGYGSGGSFVVESDSAEPGRRGRHAAGGSHEVWRGQFPCCAGRDD